MDKTLSRFFTIMGCYLDDDRIAAHAICHFKDIDDSPEMVYKDLLACRYTVWIDHLENIADDTKHAILKEWCQQKQFELDMMRSSFWSKGDERMIEMEAWNL